MDNFVLNGPQGTSLNIGSWLDAQTPPDLGFKDLTNPIYVTNPLTEGGQLLYEVSNIRHMTFHLTLASQAAWGGLNTLEGQLRELARPNATLDIQLTGVASADAIRFDVNQGRVIVNYDVWQHNAGVHLVDLELDVDPFGYLPTWIILASAASVGLPGTLTIPAGSVMGDAPGLAAFTVHPTAASSFVSNWMPDMVAWSLAAQPSFVAFIPAGSWTSGANLNSPTLTADAFAPASQTYRGNIGAAWGKGWVATIPPSLEPAYRGRFHAFAFAKHTQTPSLAPLLSLDASFQTAAALASTQFTGTVAQASPGYSLVDLGEIILPPGASGVPQPYQLRLWGKGTATVSMAGVYLLPVDGPAGIIPYGLAQPSVNSASVGRFHLDAYTRRSLIAYPTGDTASIVPMQPAALYHRGALPYVTPSVIQLDIIAGMEPNTATPTAMLPVRQGPMYAAATVRYRPRFQFLRGI